MELEQLVGSEAFDEIRGRSFGIDPDSRYSEKEFLERAEDLFSLNACHSKIIDSKNGGDIGALRGLAEIALKYMPGYKAKNMEILQNPFAALKQAEVLLERGYKNMAGYAARNLDRLLTAMDEKTLVEIAAMLPGKGKEYVQINKYMRRGDMKAARKIYAEIFEDEKAKKDILEPRNAELIKHYMEDYVDNGKKYFMNQNLSIQVQDGKETVYRPDIGRVKKYITSAIAKCEDKDKSAVYNDIATALYNSKKGIQEKEESPEELPMAA